MGTTVQMHRAMSLKIESICVDNMRHISLLVQRKTEDGGDIEISIFGLPIADLNRIVETFGQPKRYDYMDMQAVYPDEMRKLQAENHELREQLRLRPDVSDATAPDRATEPELVG